VKTTLLDSVCEQYTLIAIYCSHTHSKICHVATRSLPDGESAIDRGMNFPCVPPAPVLVASQRATKG
jgi:hypothetical protein